MHSLNDAVQPGRSCLRSDIFVLPPDHDQLQADFLHELAEIEVESMGWIPLEDGAYLHVGRDDGVVEIVGLADVGMADSNVLWIV